MPTLLTFQSDPQEGDKVQPHQVIILNVIKRLGTATQDEVIQELMALAEDGQLKTKYTDRRGFATMLAYHQRHLRDRHFITVEQVSKKDYETAEKEAEEQPDVDVA